MFATLIPANWLDWLIALYTALGVVAGLRRGLIMSLVAVGATVAAIALAAHFEPAAVAFAQGKWHLQAAIATLVAHTMPIPDGAGATPYSPSAAALLGQQIATVATPSYATALARILGQPVPAAGAPPATLGVYVYNAIAERIVALLAFVVIVLVAEGALLLLGRLALGGVARRGWAGALNALSGGAAGGFERLAQVTLLLAALASLSLVPDFSGLARVLDNSHWALTLVAVLRRALPASQHWFAARLPRA